MIRKVFVLLKLFSTFVPLKEVSMKEEFNIYIRKKNDNLYVAYTEDNVLYATGDTIKKVVDNVFETKDRFVKNLKKEGDLGKANELDLSLARINMSEELMVEFRKQIKITSFLSGQESKQTNNDIDFTNQW